jgi:hypothetical protein
VFNLDVVTFKSKILAVVTAFVSNLAVVTARLSILLVVTAKSSILIVDTESVASLEFVTAPFTMLNVFIISGLAKFDITCTVQAKLT